MQWNSFMNFSLITREIIKRIFEGFPETNSEDSMNIERNPKRIPGEINEGIPGRIFGIIPDEETL